jgi:NTP pyrophosphatase (non-canonical NTP hydrolase)
MKMASKERTDAQLSRDDDERRERIAMLTVEREAAIKEAQQKAAAAGRVMTPFTSKAVRRARARTRSHEGDTYSSASVGAPRAAREENVLRLWRICESLRDRDPWTKKQTVATMIAYSREEASEVEAELPGLTRVGNSIDQLNGIEGELGDLLFDALLILQVAKRQYNVDPGRVVAGIEAKLRRRCPYMFDDFDGDVPADEESAKQLWQQQKANEKCALPGSQQRMHILGASVIGGAVAVLVTYAGWRFLADR